MLHSKTASCSHSDCFKNGLRDIDFQSQRQGNEDCLVPFYLVPERTAWTITSCVSILWSRRRFDLTPETLLLIVQAQTETLQVEALVPSPGLVFSQCSVAAENNILRTSPWQVVLLTRVRMTSNASGSSRGGIIYPCLRTKHSTKVQ